MQLHVGRPTAIVVNGEASETGAATLAELVAALGFGEARWRPRVNGDFVPRAGARRDQLATGDSIEIVAPRQGG